MRKSLLLGLLLLLLPGVLALSFSSGPTVYFDGANVTTTDPFACRFTPSGTGSLTANITWYQDGSNYAGADQSTAVSDGVQFTSSQVSTSATSKGEDWRCQVTLDNTTTSNASNSSPITIQNTLPDINDPAQLIYFEDTPVSFTFTATDDDNDTIVWSSLDTDRGSYGNEELFIIESDGDVTISETDEDLVGNHTMQITACEDSCSPGNDARTAFFEFQLVAVNDAPIFNVSSLNYTCNEAQSCNGQISGTDEDNISSHLTYAFNESFVNGSSDGGFTFVPIFEQVGNHTIAVNVTDGNSTVSGLLNITILSQNHAPNVSYSNVSATQGDASFIFDFNVTDSLDPNDAFNFSVASACDNSPWVMQNISNGLNSTTAIGRINTSLSNNSYVACRDITVSVYEIDTSSGNPRDTYTYNLTLNITNINDAPVINEVNAAETQPNISSQTAALGLSYSYIVNATDVDQDTYEGDTLTYSLMDVPTFGGGGVMFVINSTTGEVTSSQSSMNASYTGMHTFTVVATDNLTPNLNDTRNLTVTISVNAVPQFLAFNTTACAENFSCVKDLRGNDTDGEASLMTINSLVVTDPLNSTTTYTNATQVGTLLGLNTSDGTTIGNVTTFTLNFTPDDADRGTYVLNFTFQDPVGNTNTTLFTFNVTNTEESPQFDDNADHAIIDPVTLSGIYETVRYEKNIYLVDDDLRFGSDNLTFNYSLNDTLSGFAITQVNNTLATIDFTPTNTQAGTYSVNLTLTDSTNRTAEQTVVFTIADTSAAPLITEVRPFYTGGTTVTTLTSINASDNTTSVTGAENDTVVFDFRAQDADNTSMNVSWYVNGTFNESSIYNAASPNHALAIAYGFFDEGVYNITAVVEDIGEDQFTWIITVADTNRPPQLINSARNLTGASAVQSSGSVFFSNFFFLNWDDNIVFYDPDDDPDGNQEINLSGSESNSLMFTLNTSGSCDELGTFEFNDVDDNLTIEVGSSGTCTTNFIATDPYNASVSSNMVTIQFVKTESSSSSSTSTSSRTRTITETVTVPIEEPVDVPAEFDLIRSGTVVQYANNSARIPLSLVNDWDEDMSGITLGVNNTGENFSYSFEQQYFDELLQDQIINTTITIHDYRTTGPIAFNISAFIGSMQHTDHETIYVNALEKGREDIEAIRSRLGFARDLLSDNPECGELLEVIAEAEANPQGTSIEVINNVINGCKYLIGENVDRSDAFPKSFTGKLSLYGKTIVDYNLLFTVLAGLLGAAIIIGLVVRFTMKKI